VENEPGKMPDGAVIIAAITSTNTNNPQHDRCRPAGA
jgi:aconitate hydratase